MKKRLYSIINSKKNIIALFCTLLTVVVIIMVNRVFAEDKRALAQKSTENTSIETEIVALEKSEEEGVILEKSEEETITITQHTSEPVITVDQVKELALNKTGGGTVVKCETDYEDGRFIYDVKVVNGNIVYEMDIDAANATIYEYKEEVVTTETIVKGTGTANQISVEQAKEIALKKAGEGTVIECKLDYENGIYVYEIEIMGTVTKYDIEVKADDGSIIKFEIDS